MPEISTKDAEALDPIGSQLDEAERSLGTPLRVVEICNDVLKGDREKIGELNYCRAHYLRGFANRLVGELRSAESDLFFAKQLAFVLSTKEPSAKELLARSTLQLGLVYVDEQHNERAAQLLQQAVSRFAALSMINAEAQSLFSLAMVYRQMKRPAEAVAELESALIKFTDIGSDEGIAAVHNGLVHIAMDRGQYLEAKERAERCLKILPERSLPKNRIFLELTLADACMHLGELDRAIDMMATAILAAEREGYPLVEARGLVLQYHALNKRGDTEGAKASLEKAERLSDAHGFQSTLDAIKKENGI